MKNKKYKTIKLLFVFLAIIFIIFGIIKYAKKLLQNQKDDDMKTGMLMIQAKIKILKGKSEVNANTNEYLGKKVTDENNQQINELLKKIKIPENEFQDYYILKKSDFETMGITAEVNNIEDNNYIVNYNTAEVIYTKGIAKNNKTLYKLSDLIKEDKKIWILYERIEV